MDWFDQIEADLLHVVRAIPLPGISGTELLHMLGVPVEAYGAFSGVLKTMRERHPQIATQRNEGPKTFGHYGYRWHTDKAPRVRPVDNRTDEQRRADLDAAIAHDMGED